MSWRPFCPGFTVDCDFFVKTHGIAVTENTRNPPCGARVLRVSAEGWA